MSAQQQSLPDQLTQLTGQALHVLGDVIHQQYGQDSFAQVEKLRQTYKGLRQSDYNQVFAAHLEVFAELEGAGAVRRLEVAHSFAVSLELINACENAYRTHRLRLRPEPKLKADDGQIIFVLTAHPTEARRPEFIRLMEEVTEALTDSLDTESFSRQQLFHLLSLALQTPLARTDKPAVADEANFIYSVALKERNLRVLANWSHQGTSVRLRTWVGGDKDGHPGVNAQVMRQSLSLARQSLLKVIANVLDRYTYRLELLPDKHRQKSVCLTYLNRLRAQMKAARTVRSEDGLRIKKLKSDMITFCKAYDKLIGEPVSDSRFLQQLLELFPGLVVPLELREDSALVHAALTKTAAPISGMLKTLKDLAKGGDCQWYARGFVLSMTESAEDVLAAKDLMKSCMGGLKLPIVPLFETRLALQTSTSIVSEILENKELAKAYRERWSGKFEVMLGYSDSAKESGSLRSRVMIAETLRRLDTLLFEHDLVPIFFHGSGGSVERGGGSLENQISWWPESARKNYKATMQGEMIYRNFASAEILNRQIGKIAGARQQPEAPDLPSAEARAELENFSRQVSDEYQGKIAQPSFLNMVEFVTPYPYLDELKIGSRPAKRKGQLQLTNLRAIPWVLCWTQTRVLFPVWWGMGSSWAQLSDDERNKLRECYAGVPEFTSFVKSCSFSLAKVDLSVWRAYVELSQLPDEEKTRHFEDFESEFLKTLRCMSELTGEDEFLWFRPWLNESIRLRTTMIHPLNLLEILAFKQKQLPLLRECVTGIASGMLTTG